MAQQESAKERILNAAIQLSQDRSVQFIQMRDVAEAAGVSSSLVAFHFKTLHDLMIEVRLCRWEDFGVPSLMAWFEANPDATLAEILHYYMVRDLEHGHRSRDLMAMAWWWSAVDEARYQSLLEHRIGPVRKALQRACPKMTEAQVTASIGLIRIATVGLLREAHVAKLGPVEAAAQLMAMLQPLLDAYA
jgi:AcrR family transcriptional regulator